MTRYRKGMRVSHYCEIVGNLHTTGSLRDSIMDPKVAHSYIFIHMLPKLIFGSKYHEYLSQCIECVS